jgi:hypothetical protein
MSAPPAEWRRIVIRTADVALHRFGEYASEFKAVERYGISVVYEAVFLREALLACMREQKLYFAFMHPRPFPDQSIPALRKGQDHVAWLSRTSDPCA